MRYGLSFWRYMFRIRRHHTAGTLSGVPFMDTRNRVDARAAGLMCGLCALWGLQQVAVKVAAGDMAPVLQLSVRSGLAAILVWLLVLWRGQDRVFERTTLWPGLAVGCLFALEFLFVGEGLRYTSASRMVIFLYCAPIFTAIGLHLLIPSERLSLLQWLGILLAFAGVVTAFYAPTASHVVSPDQRLGDALALLAAIAWAATTVTVRCTRLASAPASQTLLYQLLGAGVLLMLAAWLTGQTQLRLSQVLLLSLAFQTLLVAFLSFLVWFWLLRNYLASRLGVLSFLAPLFGVIFGVWLLDEVLEPAFIIGALLVMAGIAVVSGHDLFKQWVVARRPGP